jgi:hypothetical protein
VGAEVVSGREIDPDGLGNMKDVCGPSHTISDPNRRKGGKKNVCQIAHERGQSGLVVGRRRRKEMAAVSVNQWLDQEKQLEQKHGSNIIFEIRRMTVDLETEDVHLGPKIGTVLLAGDGGGLTGTHTVQNVMDKVRKMIEAQELLIFKDDHIVFMLNGKVMHPETLFFADHYLLLPCWIQVGVIKR